MLSKTSGMLHPNFKWNGQFVTQDELVAKASEYCANGADFEKQIGSFILDWFSNSPTIELHTSGTTGSPKSISIAKQAMINSAIATGLFFDLKPSASALLCLPVNYIAGKMMLVRSFVLGLELDTVEPTATPLETNKKTYDFCAMVPLQVQNSIGELHRIKQTIVGGAKVSEALKTQLLSLPNPIFETYGMTETVSHIAIKRIGETAFTTVPTIKIETDSRGCLVIHAPSILEKPLVTNDLVELISATQFNFIGRIDSVINSGGIKLFPEQIETALAPAIEERFFIIGAPDNQLGEKVVLVIEGAKRAVPTTIFDSLAPYQKPKEIRFISQFLLTESGKIRRKASFDLSQA